MQKRQVLLKINTSGVSIPTGNRIVEIDCTELANGKPTPIKFHRYINPNRIIESAAFKKHGLSYQFLRKYLSFKEIAYEFLEFIHEAELLIENMPFVVNFINREFEIIGWQPLDAYCKITSINPPTHAIACRLARSESQVGLALLTC